MDLCTSPPSSCVLERADVDVLRIWLQVFIELPDLFYQKQLLRIAFAAWSQVFVVCGGQR
jgi:hypothetical protein